MSGEAQRRAFHARKGQDSSASEATGEKDLNDPDVQNDILNPQPKEVELSFTTIKLYPMTAKQQRKFHGFATTVMAATIQNRHLTAGDGNSEGYVSTLYLMGSLSQSDKLSSELLGFVSYAADPPGDSTPERAANLYNMLDEKCIPKDLLNLYAVLSEMSGYTKSLKEDAEKAKAQQAKKEKEDPIQTK